MKPLLLGLVLLCGIPLCSQPTRADDFAGNPAVHWALRDVINAGADLFNLQGDYSDCYRLYQGSLVAIKPHVSAKLRGDIEQALADAEGKNASADKAFRLRETIDFVREQTQPYELITAPPLRVR